MIIILEEVKEKIDKAVKPENIMLIDNSALHSKHKFYDPKKFHLPLLPLSGFEPMTIGL